MKTKDKIKKQTVSGLIPRNIHTFYRNRVNSMVFKSKRYHHHQTNNNNKDAPRKTLKTMTNTPSNSSPILLCLNDNNYLANFQWFAVVWTLIYHDLRHHMVNMLWTHEAQPSESATNFDHVMT
jgi:hypothetical protein